MKEAFNSAKPKHEFVMEYIIKMIVFGNLAEGDKLPTPLEISKELDVNLNTVQCALSELANRGLLSSKRGEGRFIGDKSKAFEMLSDIADLKSQKYFADMAELGFTKEASLNFMKKRYKLFLKKTLVVEKLYKKYKENVVLNNVSFEVEEGQIVGLIGDRQSGKTTILKAIGGYLNNYQGTIKILEENFNFGSKKHISYMPSENFLNDSLTVVNMIKYVADIFEDFHIEKAVKLAKINKIPLKSKIKKLNKIEKLKFQLIITLCKNSQLYLLDDPLRGLSDEERHDILSIISSNIPLNSSFLIACENENYYKDILTKAIYLEKGKINKKKTDEKTEENSIESEDNDQPLNEKEVAS